MMILKAWLVVPARGFSDDVHEGLSSGECSADIFRMVASYYAGTFRFCVTGLLNRKCYEQ